jgi:hypothetical protein
VRDEWDARFFPGSLPFDVPMYPSRLPGLCYLDYPWQTEPGQAVVFPARDLGRFLYGAFSQSLLALSVLLPAYLLWRQRTSSDRPAATPVLFLCALGCALILLFPVISATDDLHVVRPEMEDSERGFRRAGNGACTPHALAHSSQPILPSLASPTPEFEQIGTVLPFTPQSRRTFSASATACRAPPFENPTSL